MLEQQKYVLKPTVWQCFGQIDAIFSAIYSTVTLWHREEALRIYSDWGQEDSDH